MDIIDKLKNEVKNYMEGQGFSSHDYSHVLRVYNLCKIIGKGEGINIDMDVLEAAALLHDLCRGYEKEDAGINHAEMSANVAEQILKKIGFPKDKIPKVVYAIRTHRFTKGILPETIEARVLQDADRIDTSGAIGIAMIFAYAGAHNRAIYSIDDPFAKKRKLDDNKYALDHFFNKILKLPNVIHTEVGKKICEKRIKFVKLYLEQFKKELECIM